MVLKKNIFSRNSQINIALYNLASTYLSEQTHIFIHENKNFVTKFAHARRLQSNYATLQKLRVHICRWFRFVASSCDSSSRREVFAFRSIVVSVELARRFWLFASSCALNEFHEQPSDSSWSCCVLVWLGSGFAHSLCTYTPFTVPFTGRFFFSIRFIWVVCV